MGSRTRSLVVLLCALALAATLGLSPATAADGPRPPGPVAKGNPDFTANVMAPLKVTDWADFEHDLAAVKAYGVDAVSVDVWWGDVEKAGDNRFDWSYYDRVFRTITDAGLDIAPIFSFHQCGGNVGDDYTSLLPAWLWKKYAGRRVDGIRLGEHGLQHRSEQGNYSPETVQGWADRVVANEYRDFTEAFTRHFERELRQGHRRDQRVPRPVGRAALPVVQQPRHGHRLPDPRRTAVLLAARGQEPPGVGASIATGRCAASTGPGTPTSAR